MELKNEEVILSLEFKKSRSMEAAVEIKLNRCAEIYTTKTN